MPGRLAARETPTGWRVHAPAKVNLSLEVLAKRPDGFHEVRTLLCPLRLGDSLLLKAIPGRDRAIRLAIRTTLPHAVCPPPPADESNLVVRVLRQLQQATGCDAGCDVTLIKRTPSQAGLGGGSSDAAAALVAANAAWQLGLSTGRMVEIAAHVGSDVPALLMRDASYCGGRGERLTPMPIPSGLPVVLAKAGEGLATAKVFSHWRSAGADVVEDRAGRIAQSLWQGDWQQSAQLMTNHLQPIAAGISASLRRMTHLFDQLSLITWQMTGSGAALMGLCRSQAHAARAAAWLRNRGVTWTAATCTC